VSRTIALTGMPGAGKSAVGAVVAARLGRTFVDSDDEIERALDRSITTIVAEAGIAYFREVEHQVLRRLLRHDDLVVGLGGGAVLRDDNVAEVVLTGVLVHLDVPVDVLLARLLAAPDEVARRPLLHDDPGTALRRLHAERDARYREVADVVVDARGAVADVAEEVLRWARTAGDVLTPSEHELTM
jgi:shikimate kinase